MQSGRKQRQAFTLSGNPRPPSTAERFVFRVILQRCDVSVWRGSDFTLLAFTN